MSWVAPNATCPVCGAAVYFYANEHGSRVYFDELGPPWPKHPCTSQDKPARGGPTGGPSAPTVRRDGSGGGGTAPDGRGRPLVVELVVHTGARTLVHLRSLPAGGQTKVWISDSTLAVSSGQVVFLSADVMSYIDMARMKPATAPLTYMHSKRRPSLLERLFWGRAR